jgi:hypothetical protein
MGELRKARKKTADMTNVKDRGPFNPKHMAEGDYVAKITEVYDTESNEGKAMWVIAFQLQDRRDVVYPYYCTWDDSQLWKIRNVFVACGVSIPKKRVALDPTRITGKTIGITLEDDEYNGKPKSVIASVMSLKDMENGPDADDVADDDDDEIEDVDGEIEEDDEEEEPLPVKKRRRKKAPEPEPEEEEDDEEEDDDDEEEEEPEPPRRKKKASPSARAGGRSVKGSTAVKKKRRVVEEDDDDEIDIDEDEL